MPSNSIPQFDFIEGCINAERELMLIATLNGEHIGNCSLMSAGPYRRYSHRCDIAIALYQKFCGAGIGEIMLRTVLDVAKNIGYEQAELEVIADNTAAIALYEKLGFEKYGRFPHNMKYSDGSYADAIWMMKMLTSDEILFFITFDESGTAIKCEEDYRPGG